MPHHLTQRGKRREDIFLTDEDWELYLAGLEDYCPQHGVDILAYGLMTNHIHLVAVPARGCAPTCLEALTYALCAT